MEFTEETISEFIVRELMKEMPGPIMRKDLHFMFAVNAMHCYMKILEKNANYQQYLLENILIIHRPNSQTKRADLVTFIENIVLEHPNLLYRCRVLGELLFISKEFVQFGTPKPLTRFGVSFPIFNDTNDFIEKTKNIKTEELKEKLLIIRECLVLP